MVSERDDFLKHVDNCTASAVVEPLPLGAVAEPLPLGTRPIVLIDRLRPYLTRERLRKLLLHVGSSDSYEDAVRNRYLAVFSVLVSINKGIYLPTFVQHDHMADGGLPFLTRGAWPDPAKPLFDEFYDAQWRFCPKRLVFGQLHDTWLHENVVVPFKQNVILKEGVDSIIHQVELFDEYNHVLPTDSNIPPTNVFILKSSRSDNAKFHNNEVKAYRTLLSHPSGQDAMQHMARFYGSWTQGETRYILREYVGGGTLTDFFERTDPPTTMEDILIFWRNFIQVIKPIACIHHLPNPHDHHSFKAGLHNDIKLDNILVSEQRERNPYNVSFKLSDLGLAGFVVADDSDEAPLRDAHGTKMYSAPEYFRGETDRSMQQSIKQAHPAKDIWALGCVISEAAVWSVLGHKGLIEYHGRRVEAAAANPSLQNTGYRGCFHDTTKVLAVVEQMHQEVIYRRRAHIDSIVIAVLLTVGGMMDQEPSKRPDAWKVYGDLTRAVDQAMPPVHNANTRSPSPNNQPRHSIHVTLPPSVPNGLGIDRGALSLQSPSNTQWYQPNHLPDRRSTVSGRPSPRPLSDASSIGYGETSRHDPHGLTPNDAHGPQRISMPAMQSPISKCVTPVGQTARPSASIKEVLDYIRRKKMYPPTILPGEESLKRLHGRDQIFLVDDSESMLPYWKEAQSAFEALAYLVKTMDPDGIELHFTNSREHNGRGKDRKRLIKNLEKVKPYGQCEMGIALSNILPHYYQNPPQTQTNKRSSWSPRAEEKPAVNIYILTDGVWSPGQHCLSTIQEHITNLTDNLWRAGKLQHVGIEFIRFGNDDVGKLRLEFLDNDEKQHYPVPIDIVDTEPSTGNVFKMLLANTDSSWDNEPSG